MEYIKTLSVLEKVINVPIFSIIGSISKIPLYISTEQGQIGLHALGKEPIRLTNAPVFEVARPKPDADFVPFTRDTSRGKELHSINIAALNGEEYEVYNAKTRITSLAYDGEKVAFISNSGGGGGLFLEEGGEAKKLSDISPFSFVRDVGEKYVIGDGMLTGNPRSRELFVAPLTGGKPEIFTPKEGSLNKAFEIQNESVYFTSDYETEGEASRLYKFDLQSRIYERIEFSGKDLGRYDPVEILQFELSSNLLIGGRDGETRIFRDGSMVKTPRGVVDGATDIGGDIFFSHSSLNSPYRILKADRRGKIRTVIANKRVGIGTVEYKKMRTDVTVPAWIVKPKNRASRIGIVMVHGGPWDSVDNRWDFAIAPFAMAGYTVIAPNFRGSTGYGSRFMQMDINDAGGGDLRDVISSRDYLVKNKIVDHVGIMGGSYGGFMTFLATAKYPELWEFGIAIAGAPDWEEMKDLSDPWFKTFIGMLFGNNTELMKDRSAKNFVANVKAPLCIIHSQNDSRTPLMPVLRYVQKLQELDRRFEMHVIPDMGHTITSMRDAVDLLFPALAFLEKLYH
jgi:dipeptidyl aminopeptidase/acylaminoacyl peptidase